jgi:hypothetical protein
MNRDYKKQNRGFNRDRRRFLTGRKPRRNFGNDLNEDQDLVFCPGRPACGAITGKAPGIIWPAQPASPLKLR